MTQHTETTTRTASKVASRGRGLPLRRMTTVSILVLLGVLPTCCVLRPSHAFHVTTERALTGRRRGPRTRSWARIRCRVLNMVAEITSSETTESTSSCSSQPPNDHQNHIDIRNDKELMKSRLSMVRPPPRQQHESSMTRHEIEFRDLLEGILYTQHEINAVVNPRLRTVLEGIAASYYDPAVYRAFEVLYCDAGPLRMAGRIVYGKLRNAVERSTRNQQEQFDSITSTTNLRRDEIESCWLTYLKWMQYYEYDEHRHDHDDDGGGDNRGDDSDNQHHGDGRISIQSLYRLIERSVEKEDTMPPTNDRQGSVATVLKNLNSESIDDALMKINPDFSESLSFEQLMKNVYAVAANASTHVMRSSSTTRNLMNEVFDMDDDGSLEISLSSSTSLSKSSKKYKYNQRYDEMLEKFDEWKQFIMPQSGENNHMNIDDGGRERQQQRRFDIMKGCFVGSENPKVVEALRVIYVDNAILRLSGDWIFKTVSMLINRRKQQQRNRQEGR